MMFIWLWIVMMDRVMMTWDGSKDAWTPVKEKGKVDMCMMKNPFEFHKEWGNDHTNAGNVSTAVNRPLKREKNDSRSNMIVGDLRWNGCEFNMAMLILWGNKLGVGASTDLHDRSKQGPFCFCDLPDCKASLFAVFSSKHLPLATDIKAKQSVHHSYFVSLIIWHHCCCAAEQCGFICFSRAEKGFWVCAVSIGSSLSHLSVFIMCH